MGGECPALFTHLFPADLTIGEMVGILFLAALAAAVLVSVVVMLLAELTRNAIAAMAVVLGILLLTTMIYAVPENLRGWPPCGTSSPATSSACAGPSGIPCSLWGRPPSPPGR